MEIATLDNEETYRPVVESGVASLKCLGCEVFGRWSADCVELVPKLARDRTRGLHVRVRRGLALALQRRWWGLLGISLQRAVARQILRHGCGADLFETGLESPAALAQLDVL